MFDFFVTPVSAQAAVDSAVSPSLLSPLMMMVVFFAVFYFIAIRPQMKRAKEHRQLLANLGKGDEVIVAGGVLGQIEELGESVVTVEIAEGITIKVQKNTITTVLPKGTIKTSA